ncbi:MAG: HAD-IA family hydrolase [Deltaproteobacteria bacterium]|nr:HAD-IA family hydrolase [Deltaproteobacteria bacterium]
MQKFPSCPKFPIDMADIPEITIDTLLEQYDVLLFDAYGVLVHSSGALPGAIKLVQRLNRMRKSYYILTNDASRLPETASQQYRSYGLDITPERIITSGSLLKPYFIGHQLIGLRCVVLGPADSLRYVEHAGGRVVSPGGAFDVLVIADEAGFPFLETIDRMFTSLCRAIDARRKIHLILPNPDLIYPKGDRAFGFAAGSIAGMFEAALCLRYPHRDDLRFARLGKPEKGIFTEALSRSGTRNMVMIGDQLETDIKGARTFGIDAVWVEAGVTAKVLAALPVDLQPTYRLGTFAGNVFQQ